MDGRNGCPLAIYISFKDTLSFSVSEVELFDG